MTTDCPFCRPDSARVFHESELVYGLWDGYPVSQGHALLIPRRHVVSWFDTTSDEQIALFQGIEVARGLVEAQSMCEGFNIGINVGAAAGQTVPHLHVHLIPRRPGDVPDPRGGVRHVIPNRANYLAMERGLGSPATEDLAYPRRSEQLLAAGGETPLLPLLETDWSRASWVNVAVAFILPSGVSLLYPHLEDLLRRGGVLRVLAGDYLDITDPDALQPLLDLQALYPSARIDLRVFESAGRSFHPKTYIAGYADGTGIAFVGSSNVSESALRGGIEWNYRIMASRDRAGYQRVCAAFFQLFCHQATRALDQAWIDSYRKRRRPPTTHARQAGADDAVVDVPQDVLIPPDPNSIQKAALQALDDTRAEGYRAGLVVLATGLGKTWLSAFDSASTEFRRILFVAHRDEILTQAVGTFRRIRPEASIGLYTGTTKFPEANILFASIQTLGRQIHLDRFDRQTFDYIVVDEFHHASAPTYRRLIDHFEPKFMLGLTATPARSDGGDLLSLCQENLVYESGVAEGIRRDLLCPFTYFGVPDDVDYANIPWRSHRFDEEKLTQAVATERRANNVFEQWGKHGGTRTLAFCVSVRHADFMRAWFLAKDIPVAAVHSGSSSDPRALSLEDLGTGKLRIIFAVDVFNEGVDLPQVDTVMMLRPTESQIIWTQQFGRGLRKHGDKRLRVIDYIGNHRTFLLKARTLLALRSGNDRELDAALTKVQSGQWELPPGCEIVYDLAAIDIMRALLRLPTTHDALKEYYQDYRESHAIRPTASEAMHDGYLPRAARQSYGSWLDFVASMGDLSDVQQAALNESGILLRELDVTSMTRSYKMVLLLAMLNLDGIPGPGAEIAELVDEFRRVAARSAVLSADMSVSLDDIPRLRDLVEANPINAWTGGRATGVTSVFEYSAGTFAYTVPVSTQTREAFQELLRELLDWRLAEYLSRHSGTPSTGFLIKVGQASGKPILFPLEREKYPGIPVGWQTISVGDHGYEANFVKIAVNVVREIGSSANVLPKLLREWFGPDAGQPGTNHFVSVDTSKNGLELKPVDRKGSDAAELWKKYSREQIPRLFGQEFSQAIWNVGYVALPTSAPRHLFLLVTLNKHEHAANFQYGDRFLSPDQFQWQSQNRTSQSGKHGALIQNHRAQGVQVHLFVRSEKKIGGAAAPFFHCGPVVFQSWEGDKPITVIWRLQNPVPSRIYRELAGESARQAGSSA